MLVNLGCSAPLCCLTRRQQSITRSLAWCAPALALPAPSHFAFTATESATTPSHLTSGLAAKLGEMQGMLVPGQKRDAGRRRRALQRLCNGGSCYYRYSGSGWTCMAGVSVKVMCVALAGLKCREFRRRTV